MIILKDEGFEKEVAGTDKFVLIDFFATWCGPCSVLGPILEKMEKEFEGKVVFAKANVDETPLNSQKFGVDKIPMVALLKNGKQVNGFVGLIPEQAIKDWLNNAIK